MRGVRLQCRSIGEGILRHCPPLLALAVILCIILLPLFPATMLDKEVFEGDALQNCYLVNWGQHILPRNPSAYMDPPIFFPQRGMGAHTEVNPFMCLLTSPFRLTGNPILSYNLMMVMTILLCGAVAYGVLYRLTGSRGAAVLGAVVFAANGDQLWHVTGHPNVISPIFIPVCLYYHHRFREEGRLSDAILCATALLLQSACSLYLGAILGIGLAAAWLWGIITHGHRGPAREAAFLAVILLSVIIVYTMASPYRDLQERLGQTRGLHDATRFSADLSGYLLPSHGGAAPRPLSGRLVGRWIPHDQRLENAQFNGWLPTTVTILALGGVFLHRRLGRSPLPGDSMLAALGVVALVGLLLSLGPFLRVGSRPTTIPLPFRYIHEWLPPLRFMRATSRFSVLVSWFVAAGFAIWISRWPWLRGLPRGRRSCVFAVVGAVLVLEFFPVDAPGRLRPDGVGAQALAMHPEYTRVTAAPLDSSRFPADAALTFPFSSSGSYGGVYNHAYRERVKAVSGFPDAQSLAIHAADGMEAVLVYGEDICLKADRQPGLQPVERWIDGGLYELRYDDPAGIAQARALLDAIPERPAMSTRPDFPPTAGPETAWDPTAWIWFDESGEPTWREYGWDRMKREGFRHDDLGQLFCGSLEPRPCDAIKALHLRVRLKDPGVDHVQAALYWTTVENELLDRNRRLVVFMPADGEDCVLTFDVSQHPLWPRGESMRAFYLELPVEPYPGQVVRLDEIRIEPVLPPDDVPPRPGALSSRPSGASP